MRGIQLEDQLEQIEFAKRAAAKFAGDPKMFTYTDKDIQPGCLFAMRWGMGDDCVVVFKLDDYFEPTNYHQLIKDFQPPSKEMKAIYQQARTEVFKNAFSRQDAADALAYAFVGLDLAGGKDVSVLDFVRLVPATVERQTPTERQAQQNVALERAKLVCGFAERAAAVFRDSAMCIHWCDIRGDANYHGTQHLNALRDGNDVLVVDRTNNKVTRMAGMINESQPEGQVNEGSECD